MMVAKKCIVTAAAVLAMCAAWGVPTVSDLKVTPVAPWGMVIDYTVSGATDSETNAELIVTATDGARTYTASHLSGATNCVNGSHRVYWNMAKDGITAMVADGVVQIEYVFPYCVVDLSGGASATCYPVSYLSAVPAGGWTDEHKTTKLVLRRIEAGSFIMGGGTTPESHRVTLTKPFYVGVFEITQAQWELVMGSNPSDYMEGYTRPIGCVSYIDICRPSGFLDKLRFMTGLNDFDLPTEAQWEYACRAGTTSKFNNGGDTEEDLKTLGRWDNRLDGRGGYTDGHTTVGSYKPNAYGLYDMHGNVSEWCRDWYDTLDYGVDPTGASSGSMRVMRGGHWNSFHAGDCTSSDRSGYDPSLQNYSRRSHFGFRVVRTLDNKTE